MSESVVVIAGSGQAGLQAAISLRQDGFDGKIIMFGYEKGLPYQRPPLSKTFLKEGRAERLLFRAEDFFANNSIELVDRSRVEHINRRACRVEIAGRRGIEYGNLILATGTRNRVPPIPGNDLDNVFELRTLEHAEQLRVGLAAASHLIIVGGGFIGLETASVARALGLAVTVIETATRPMARAVSAETSAYLLACHRQNGVDVRCGVSVDKIVEGERGKACGVIRLMEKWFSATSY
jgi:3-phenylpropionate/trans-cinnamate dioxygenase ferredoxin reductase component